MRDSGEALDPLHFYTEVEQFDIVELHLSGRIISPVKVFGVALCVGRDKPVQVQSTRGTTYSLAPTDHVRILERAGNWRTREDRGDRRAF